MDVNNADDKVLVVAPKGRLDAHGANGLQDAFDANLTSSTLCVVVDMEAIDYVSSSGLRVFLAVYKKLRSVGGELVICRIQPYCRQVLEMTGFIGSFQIFPTSAEALEFCGRIVRGRRNAEDWDCMEQAFLKCGRVRFFKGDSTGGKVVVDGDMRKILRSGITLPDMSERPIVPGEFIMGVGGLGVDNDGCRKIMGEFLSTGSALAWLPTDGNGTPDFLARRSDAGSVMTRSAFSVAFSGGFDDYLLFDADKAEGATLDELYDSLFELYSKRGGGFGGMLGLVMRAQVSSFYGSALIRAPIAELAPSDGLGILAPSNFGQWLESDSSPRHSHATAVVCGIGVDPVACASAFDEEAVARCFPVGLIQKTEGRLVTMDKAMLFSMMPFDDKDVMLESALARLRDEGNFLDVRGMLGNSTIVKALIGVLRIKELVVAKTPSQPPAPSAPKRPGNPPAKLGAVSRPPAAFAKKSDIGRLFGKG